jgi:hypothetical protein
MLAKYRRDCAKGGSAFEHRALIPRGQALQKLPSRNAIEIKIIARSLFVPRRRQFAEANDSFDHGDDRNISITKKLS